MAVIEEYFDGRCRETMVFHSPETGNPVIGATSSMVRRFVFLNKFVGNT